MWVVVRRRRGRQRRLVAVVGLRAVRRAHRRGRGRLAELVLLVGVVLMVLVVLVVVVGGRLAEEGLHVPVPAVVQHDDLDDLLTLDQRLGPQVGQAGGGLGAGLKMGGRAGRRLQLWVLRRRHRRHPRGQTLLEEQLPLVAKEGQALGVPRGATAAELVRLKPVVN